MTRNAAWAIVAGATLWALIATAGCGRRHAPRVPVHVVSGQVFVAGKPAEGAEVYFYAKTSIEGLTTAPAVRVNADGSFQPGTYDAHDGLPAGEYELFILWPKRSIVEGEEVSGDDQLQGRYSNRRRPVTTFRVQEGAENVIPRIDLTGA